MLTLKPEQRQKIADALLAHRLNQDVTDSMFAKQFGINNAVFSQIKNGNIDGKLRDSHWLEIGRKLDVSFNQRDWKTVKTDVFQTIREEVEFCKEYSKSMMFVDDCEIGKTHTAKYLSKSLRNCYYIDCSAAKTKQTFVRTLARTIGVDHTGRYVDVLANLKYYLGLIEKPIVILDEAGDLEYNAFLEIKSLWNATENRCGWYMIGADGLRDKIQRGTSRKKVGFAEIFSRFNSKYSKIVPTGVQDKFEFYKQMLEEVLRANCQDQDKYNKILKQCLKADDSGRIGGLRRLESLIILHTNG